jgi:hypothetical protein
MKSERSANPGVRAASVLMLALWLGTLALVISPQLHDCLHSDAQNLSHHCLVTQVQQHGLLSGITPAIVPVLTAPVLEFVRQSDSLLLPSSDHRLSPSRAPPSFYSSKMVAG